MADRISSTWRMFLPAAAFVALFVLWSIYWVVASSLARSVADGYREELKLRGLTLDCTTESWGGFPFRFEFTCSTPVVTLGSTASVRSGSLMVVALAYNPWQAVVLLDGPSTLAADGLLPTTIDHGRVIASATFDRKGQTRVSAEVPELSVPGLLTSRRIMLNSRPSESGLMDVAISVAAMNYQPTGRPPLVVDQGDMIGTLMPDMGLSVAKIDLAQGQTRYWGSGDIRLDAEHRIAGKLATETNDIDGLMAIVEPHLEMTEQQKSGLHMMLGLLGRQAKTDVIARDGQLYVGPFKVADLVSLY